MGKMVTISEDQLAHLEERARRLAEDKAQLELVLSQANAALVTEVRERRQAEEALRRSNDQLELQVRDRTAALQSANARLQAELAERKRAKQHIALRDFALGNVHEAAFLIGQDARLQYVNEEACRVLGYTRDQLLGLRVSDIDFDFPVERWPEHWDDLRARRSLTFESSHRTRDGRQIPVEINANYLEYDGQGYNLALVRDITERRRAEEVQHRLNRELRAISQCHQILMRAEDEQVLLEEICHTICQQAGYRMAWVGYVEQDAAKTVRPVAWAGAEGEQIARTKLSWADDSWHGHGLTGTAIRNCKIVYVQDFATDPQMAPWRELALQCGYHSGIALPLKGDQGQVFGVLVIYSAESNAITTDEVRLLQELASDLAFGVTALRARTVRKRVESIMQARVRLLEFASSHTMDELLTATLDEIEALTGSSIGFYHFLEPDQKTLSLQNWSTNTLKSMCKAEGKGSHYDIARAGVWVDCVHERRPIIHNDYASLPHRKGMPEGHAPVLREVVVPLFRGQEIKAIIGVGNKATNYNDNDIEIVSQLGDLSWDITERKRAEEVQRRLNRKLRAVSECNQAMMRAEDEPTLLHEICRIICEEAGYPMAWVGYAEQDAAKTVRPVAWAGAESGYIANARLSWAEDVARGRGPAGTAIRSGEIIYVQDFATDPRMALWRELAAQRGYRSGIAVPLKDESRNVFGVLLIYSSESNAITPDEIRLMEELAGDLAFGITALRARAERQRTQQELQESNELLRAVIEAAPTAIIGLDLNGNVQTVWNPAAEKMLGWSAQEVMGRPLPSVPMQSEEEFRGFRERMRRGITMEGVEVRRQRRDGTPIDYSIYASPLHDAQNNVVGNVAVLVDITERKRAEEVDRRLALIVGSSEDAIIAKTLDGTILTWNAGAERLYGYSAEEAIGRPISILVPPECSDELPQILERIGRGERISHYETVRIGKDGRRHHVSLAISPLTDGHGRVIGASTIARNITEQKRAEEALRESERWQRTLFEQSPVGIWEEDFSAVKQELDRLQATGVKDFRAYFSEYPDMVTTLVALIKIVQINEGTLRVFGASCKEDIPTNLPSYFREDSWEVLRDELVCLAEGNLVFESEIPIWGPQNERRILFIKLVVVPGFQETLARVVLTFTDVTALKRAEQHLRAIFDHTFQFMGLMTPDGTLIDANRGALDLVGSRASDVIGRRFWDTPWWRHDAEMRDKVRAAVQAASAGRFVRFEVTHSSLDGSVVWVDFSLTPVRDPDGRVVLLIPEGRDITDRRRTAEVLQRANAYNRSLIEASLDPLVALGMDGKVTDVNTATEQVTGYSRQELIGTNFSDYFTDRERARAGYLQVLRDGQVRDYALDLRHRDGQITSVLYHASLYRDESGQIGGVFAAARDITERKKAEERYHHLQLQLAHMGRLATMGEMVAGIAHEVNQPLYSIENYAKACSGLLAQKSPDLADLREWNEEIARSAVRAGEIIQRLRRFISRAESQHVPTSVREIINESLSLVVFETRRLEVKVHAHLPDEALMALVDRVQVQQVLVNLLQNACEALEAKTTGERTVTIRCGAVGESVAISVSDNGPGLPDLQASRVFEPFVTTKADGLGMGLAISRSIVEAHGGRIWATTDPEAGATFHITLPLTTGTRSEV